MDDFNKDIKNNALKCLSEIYGDNFLIKDLKLVSATRKFLNYQIKVKLGGCEKIHTLITLTEEGPNIVLFDGKLTKAGKSRQAYYEELGEFLYDAFN